MNKNEFAPITPENNGDRLDKKIYLATIEQFDKLPDGTKLISISGEEVIKGKDPIDMDDHPGYLGYGFLENEIPTGFEPNERNISYTYKTPSIDGSLKAAEEKGTLVKI